MLMCPPFCPRCKSTYETVGHLIFQCKKNRSVVALLAFAQTVSARLTSHNTTRPVTQPPVGLLSGGPPPCGLVKLNVRCGGECEGWYCRCWWLWPMIILERFWD